MCITIQVTCKQAITFLILFGLGLGTYLGHLSIQDTIESKNTTEEVQCVLISSNPINNDGELMYHNNWQYLYENRTYSHTDETDYPPKNYMCCINRNDAYNVIDCVTDNVALSVVLIVTAWIICWGVIVCMYVDRKKYETSRPSVEMTAVTTQQQVGANV
jgi:hypothetical protein